MTRPPVFHDRRVSQPELPAPPPHRRRLSPGVVGVLALVGFALGWLVMMLALGCSQAPPVTPAKCQGVSRAELTALYLAEVTALKASGTCEKYTEPDDCPEYRALNERNEQRRARWVECAP